MTSVESIPPYLRPGVPVTQPPNLEGDPSLATEILPGPPSLVSIQQTGVPRRDHKRTTVAPSYLPASDPGTTYTGHIATPLTTTTEVDGPRSKRARLDKGTASSRAQRASARSMNAAVVATDPPQGTRASPSHLIPDTDPMLLSTPEPTLSRATSIMNADDSTPPLPHRGRSQPPRGDKGKGREKDVGVRVKEEPPIIDLMMSGVAPSKTMGEVAPSNRLGNDDHCSSCRSLGSLIYCDGCTKAFHFWCLNPPLEVSDLPEGDASWLCPDCIAQKRPPTRVSSSLKVMAPLIEHLDSSIPVEFQLPKDIRNHFKDVGASPRGTYVDTSEVQQLRLNRLGQLEERDPYRLKDRNGDPVLCFRCGTSALPPSVAAAAPAAKRARRETSNAKSTDSGRSIVSCDYCHLHWHLDCVDPPLASMPPWGKKWMCPNHADQIFRPKRRIPRSNATPIEITKPHQPNNGNIEVVQPETPPPLPNKIEMDEVLINGRRYRVPERIIMLDFWDKLGKKPVWLEKDPEDISRMSSPLSPLSSIGDDDDIPLIAPSPPLFTVDDVEVAQLLSGLGWQQNSSRVQGSTGYATGSQQNSASNQADAGASLETNPKMANGNMKTRPKRVLPVRTSHRGGIRLRSSYEENLNDAQSTVEEDIRIADEPANVTRTRRSTLRKAGSSKDILGGAENTEALSRGQSNGTVKQEPVVAELPTHSISTRPRRTRQLPRRRLSPPPIASGRTTPLDESEAEVTGVAEVPCSATSALQAISTRRKAPSRLPSDPKPTPPSARVAVPAPTTLAGSSTVKADGTPSLKIRLPGRLANINLTSHSVSSAGGVHNTTAAPSQSNIRSSARSRSRRGAGGQASASTSLHGASMSSPGATANAV